MKTIKLSQLGDFAESKYCFPVAAKADTKKRWIEENDLFVDTDGRVYALVQTKTKVFFMDATTGSLYHFGRCVTAQNMRIEELTRNREKAVAYLMSVSFDDSGFDDEVAA